MAEMIKNLDDRLNAIVAPDPFKLMKMEEVCQLTSFSQSFIESRMRDGTFPMPKKFGSSNRWYKKDIEKWIRENMEND